ncbi:MAG: hypothetical protein ACYC5O_03795 [Anaerolineae bacterium]
MCDHPRRQEIEAALMTTFREHLPLYRVAQRFGVPEVHLVRHLFDHMPRSDPPADDGPEPRP